jgi:GNAT superfamily N-acetyltransferase
MVVQESELTVRTLGEADLDRLVRMDQQLTGRNRRQWYQGKLHRALEEADIRISLGAEDGGILVGALLGSLHYGEFGQPEPVAVLDTILVDRNAAGRGIATAMLDQLLTNLRGLGIQSLRTEISWEERELAAFLNRRGFRPLPRFVLELPVEGSETADEPRL